jgi:outer membrane protein assembly factor BamB
MGQIMRIAIRKTVLRAIACVVLLSVAGAAGHEERAQWILKEADVTGGLVVHVGCGDGKLTSALRVNDTLVVHGLDGDVVLARESIQAAGRYGPVSVQRWGGGALPYADNLVRLLLIDNERFERLGEKEIMRVVCPGGVVMVDDRKIVKPWPKEMDDWQQHYKGADNNAVAKDSLVGPPRYFRWIAEPAWSRSHVGLPSVNSMVSTGGRLFTIEDRASAENPQLPRKIFLICRDAFSGIELWRHRFPDWHASNVWVKLTPTQLQRQLVAIGNKVYCTPGFNAPITVFDASCGEVQKTFEGTDMTQEFIYDDGILYVIIGDPTDSSAYHRGKYSMGSASLPDGVYGPGSVIAEPKSSLVAIDAESGRRLWEKHGETLKEYMGASLAVRAKSVVYATQGFVVCLDKASGAEQWRTSRRQLKGRMIEPRGYKFALHLRAEAQRGTVNLIIADKGVYVADQNTVEAYALMDGAPMWRADTRMSHHKAPDLFFAAGLIWTYRTRGYDPLTGKLTRTLPQKMTGPMGHDRCYQNRITEKYYINTATGGSDFLALDGSGEFPHPWARSTCGIGHLPCNGLLYVGPPACSCINNVQLNHFNALASEPGLKAQDQAIPVQVTPRLERGIVFEKVANRESTANTQRSEARTAASDDWPTYRHDLTRSGVTRAKVSSELAPLWKTKLSTRLSAPTIADGKVFVSDIDRHTVCALDSSTGIVHWEFTAGGRVDSPPTYYEGTLLFGCRDGWVYRVCAEDGALAWRFKALPDRLITVSDQLESPWPVSGSILVKDDIAYFAAGRNSFFDGGIFMFGLNPKTGKVIHQHHQYGPYGEDGFPVMKEGDISKGPLPGLELLGAESDILLGDSKHVYMRHQTFSSELKPVESRGLDTLHLIPSPGFIEDTPYQRSFWTLDTELRYDNHAPKGPAHGDILVRDGLRFYEVRGYTPGRHTKWDMRRGGYTLVAGEVTGFAKRKVAGMDGNELWRVGFPLTGKAMVLAGDSLFVAGTPAVFPENDLAAAYEGRMGGTLWAASAKDGSKLAEYKLDAAPVWDSLAAADGKLYICTVDGFVRCFASEKNRIRDGENP